jgi:LysM repeat protein
MRAPRTLTTTTAIVILAFLALLGTGTTTVRTGVHIVKAGETLAGLAAHYGTTPSAIARANGITDPNRIIIGSRLTIPRGAGTASGSASGTTYRVRSGDTLGSIASRAGTTIAALLERNGLQNPNLIRIGQVLSIPGGAAMAPPAVTPAGGATHHVVRAGDTVAGLAARYGISQQQIIDANGLTNGVIYVGQQLRLVPATSTPAAAGSTSILCPVEGAVRFMNDWGFPRSGGRFHEGNDLFAARGTPAVAVVAGTAVPRIGTIGGQQVKLLGDNGTTYHYTHLDRFGTAGRVAAGTVIGYVGTSGNAAGTSPHLHFELHPGGGAAVNPFPYLAPVG